LIRIAITQAAFEAITATLPLGSVSYDNAVNERGERYVWLPPNVVDRLKAQRRPGEGYSHSADRGGRGAAVIPVEVTQTPWHFTTWLDLFDHWQTVIAGLAALLAAFIALVIPEWRARTALRTMLGSEIRLYVDLLIKAREMLKRLDPVGHV
jgi:hypothetical protein